MIGCDDTQRARASPSRKKTEVGPGRKGSQCRGQLFGRSIHFDQRVRVDLFRQTIDLPKLSDIPNTLSDIPKMCEDCPPCLHFLSPSPRPFSLTSRPLELSVSPLSFCLPFLSAPLLSPCLLSSFSFLVFSLPLSPCLPVFSFTS
jgi:hypothetical protein